jgi:hypothetical protein
MRKDRLEKGFCHGFQFPRTLQELILEGRVAFVDAAPLTSLTKLTSLVIELPYLCTEPFEILAALTTLRRLEICGSEYLIPSLRVLTLLTHLHFFRTCRHPPSTRTLDLAPLTRLQGLVHLDFGSGVWSMSGGQHLATVGQIKSLKSLTLGLDQGPMLRELDTSLLTALSHLTALGLTHVWLDVLFLSKFNIEGLQSLILVGLPVQPQDMMATLQRGTGLTQLTLRYFGGTDLHEALEFGLALQCMPKLQALSLEAGSLVATSCFQAIGLLTGLTSLMWEGDQLTNTSLETCLGLRQLRVLTLFFPYPTCPERRAGFDPIILETLVALARLPHMKTLKLTEKDCSPQTTLMDDIHALLYADRHDKGWPPLQLEISGL